MADDTVRSRSGGGVRGLVAWILILGLAALVVWLAAERNARTWYLVPDEGRLVVMRGILAPVGRQSFKTSDPALAQVYEPVVAPPGRPLPPERAFDERAALDQALYDHLAGWARDEIASRDPARLERGLGYLARAERLQGLSPAQHEDLAALRAESGFHEAHRLLEKAAQELRDAADKLRVAAESRSEHAQDARLLLRTVEPAADAAVDALRSAGRSPPPSAGEAAPPPGPTPPPTSAPAGEPVAPPSAGRP